MPRNPNSRSRLLTGTLFSLVALLVLALTCVFFGLITGEEIMPDTFARRRFYYWEIPLIHVQVWPITRREKPHDFVTWLGTKSYLKGGATADWHLVAFSRSGVPVVEGDARILCAYLDSKTSDNRHYWQVWSQDHPQMAAVLWPKISRLAQHGLYLAIPDLMEIAAGAKTANSLKTQLDKRLIREYADYAARRVTADDHQSAVQALSAGLELDPDNRELLEARAAAYDQLSETEKAARDRKKLQSAK